jgi:hypothetical protein
LTEVIAMSRVAIVLLKSPSLMVKLTVRVAVLGISLLFA